MCIIIIDTKELNTIPKAYIRRLILYTFCKSRLYKPFVLGAMLSLFADKLHTQKRYNISPKISFPQTKSNHKCINRKS